MLAVALTTACKQRTETAGREPEPPVVAEDTVDEMSESEETVAVEPEKKQPKESYFDRKAGSQKPVKATAAAAANKGKAETIYVETDGAQGRVWGHVTMRGDRGTGTIHDWDENTLTVTVIRHGNELYAVDQNSRQYVFRLKQNKTQE